MLPKSMLNKSTEVDSSMQGDLRKPIGIVLFRLDLFEESRLAYMLACVSTRSLRSVISHFLNSDRN